MSLQTLSEYFNTIVSGSQEFIDSLPDDFLHESSKHAYQLINEINVYLRSDTLSKKEYDLITKKTEQLIEEVEKLEIAYQTRNSGTDTQEFGHAFKSEFDQVMQKPTFHEMRSTYMGRQEIGVAKVSLFLERTETPILLGIIGSSVLFWKYGISEENMIVLLMAAGIALGIFLVKNLVRLGWIPFMIILMIGSFSISFFTN